MKCLIFLAPESARESLVDFLSDQGPGWFAVASAEGHGPALASQRMSAHDEVLGYVGLVRLELLLQDDEVAPVLAGLSAAVGSGTRRLVRHWVVPVEAAGLLEDPSAGDHSSSST